MMPQKIGRYEILSELGSGAMGQVYRAHDPNIGRQVAIKTISLDASKPELRERFKREARAAGKLAHPNIVTIFDAGEDNGVLYIAMELVEGQTVQEILRAGPLSPDKALSIALQAAAGLGHAHDQAIVHRDVKPANIMVAGRVAKVMDFGVARLESSGMTQTGQVLGTPAYLPPEMIRGEQADLRADIFSLGVVLYEMLTGMRPFAGDNISAIMFKVLSERPAEPHTLQPAVPAALSSVVMKALEKALPDRYQNCGELRAALGKCGPAIAAAEASLAPAAGELPKAAPAADLTATLADGTGGTLTMPVIVAPAAQSARNWKPILAIAAVALLVLGAAIWGAAIWRIRPGPASPVAPPSARSPVVAIPGDRAAAPPAAARARPSQPRSQPAVARAPQTGTVQVRTTPPGARVRIDDELTSRITPADVELAPGDHKISVEREGYPGESRDVTIDAGETLLLHVELKKRNVLRRINPF